MHDFRSSLRRGKAGEELLCRIMPELEALNGIGADFKHKETGDLWELKTDSYDMAKTANFFIEVYRNDNSMAAGGPFQAMDHGTKYWVYMYPLNKALFIFKVEELVTAMIPLINILKPVYIPNKGYNTIGYKVPREALKHLYEQRSYK